MKFTTTAADCRYCQNPAEVKVNAQIDAGRGIWYPNYHDGIGLFSCTEIYKAAHLEITKRRAPDVGNRASNARKTAVRASVGDSGGIPEQPRAAAPTRRWTL